MSWEYLDGIESTIEDIKGNYVNTDRVQTIENLAKTYGDNIDELYGITTAHTKSISTINTKLSEVDLSVNRMTQSIEILLSDSGFELDNASFNGLAATYTGTYFLVFDNPKGDLSYPGLLFVQYDDYNGYRQTIFGIFDNVIKSWYRTGDIEQWSDWDEFDIHDTLEQSILDLNNRIESISDPLEQEIFDLHTRIDSINTSFVIEFATEEDIYELLENLNYEQIS